MASVYTLCALSVHRFVISKYPIHFLISDVFFLVTKTGMSLWVNSPYSLQVINSLNSLNSLNSFNSLNRLPYSLQVISSLN